MEISNETRSVLVNYTDKLILLLEKYNFKKNKKSIEMMDDAIVRFLDKINDVSSGKKAAIWGGGSHTQGLMDILPDNFVQDCLKYIIDSNHEKWGIDFLGFTIISPDSPVLNEVDVVIISAFLHRQEIRKGIEARWPTAQILDVYEGYDDAPAPFVVSHTELVHWEISLLYGRYVSCENDEEREKFLRVLIGLFLDVRDMVYAKKFIELYISKHYPESGKMSVFLEELDDLLDKMRSDATKNENKSIRLMVYDSLRYKALGNSKFLSEMFENGISFPSTYSFGTCTVPSLHALLKGDVLPSIPSVKEKIESELLDQFADLEYKFYMSDFIVVLSEKYDSITDTALSYFNLPKLKSQIKRVDNITISESLWYLADYLIQNSDSNILSLVRLGELQAQIPLFKRNNLPRYNYEARHQLQGELYAEIQEYMDEQMLFYQDFFHENTLSAYLSDHGICMGENNLYCYVVAWFDPITRIVMTIHAPGYPPIRIQNVFPNYHLLAVLLRLQRGEDFSDLSREEFAICCREELRDPAYQEIVMNKMTGVANPEKFLEPFDVVIGAYDKYVRYGSGREEYYIMPNEVTNLIGDLKFSGRVDRMRIFLEKKLLASRSDGRN